MTEAEVKAVETPESTDEGIDQLSKTIEDFSEMKASQEKLDKKVDKLVEAITAMTTKAEEDKEEKPAPPKKEEDKEEEKKKEIEPKAVEVSEDVIAKAVEDKIASMGIKVPSAKPTDTNMKTGNFEIIKKAILEDGMSISTIEQTRRF